MWLKGELAAGSRSDVRARSPGNSVEWDRRKVVVWVEGRCEGEGERV